MNTIEMALKRPFTANQIHWRVGSTNAKKLGCKPWEATKGIALAYIDARDVMKRLDDVVGPWGWGTRLVTAGNHMACELSLLVDGNWIIRTDTSGETDVEGEKGAASTALKRAAAQFGVGRYLYKLPNSWVDLENGRIKQPPVMPNWATPEGFDKLVNGNG